MNTNRIERIELFKQFRDEIFLDTFNGFHEKDDRAEKFHKAYSLHKFRGDRSNRLNERSVDVFFGNRAYETMTRGSEWKALAEYGTTLLYKRNDDGFVTVFLYPANPENQSQKEDFILLHKRLNPNELLRKSVLSNHWKTFISYMECTSLDGSPTSIDKLRIGYLKLVKQLVIKNKIQQSRIKSYFFEISKFVLTVGLSGFIIFLVTLSQKDNNGIENQKIIELQKNIEQDIHKTNSILDSINMNLKILKSE
ncbi:hypothetical protein [Tenacibaculum finnmarkense]|uniref:hypothetical protein n=2 Tax=Tenacibaculum finnmarkense TaxID=2781243 RepID=UPI00230098AD|nr:hypothetical protein [Tenacibaculum finnmarkense]WCC46249.1 hypothetical protein PJH08_07530 [Tenacibaculum finnmarkense]